MEIMNILLQKKKIMMKIKIKLNLIYNYDY